MSFASRSGIHCSAIHCFGIRRVVILSLFAAALFATSLSVASEPVASEPAASESAAAAKAPSKRQIEKAVQKAADLLVSNQERYVPDRPVGTLPEDKLEEWQQNERARLAKIREEGAGEGGEWPYEGVYRVRPDGRIPAGYRVGGTAISCEAILRAPKSNKKERRAAVGRGVSFCLEELDTNPELAAGPKKGYDVRGWGHTYALQLFLTVLETGEAKEYHERIREAIPDLILRLAANEVTATSDETRGGWNYASNRSMSPFMTGPTLITLYRAQAMGFTVDADLITRALNALERGYDEKSGGYAYSGDLRRETPMPGSNARSAVAELALLQGGRGSTDRVRVAVSGFFEHWDELLKRKSKQGTHKAPYGVAPYYFFFGHTYAAMAIEYLPKSERKKWRKKLAEYVFRTREKDGGWNDRVFPRTKSYSTAMCMLSLVASSLPAIPEWKAKKKPAGEEL